MSAYHPHPYADIFPAMSDEELDALTADIRQNGLLEPIVLHDGKVLDGRHRQIACDRAGVAAGFRAYAGKDPLAFVLSVNLQRRHLSAEQKAVAAARLATLAAQRPTKRVSAQICAVNSQPEAAAAFGVSRRSVQSARKAIDCGEPEVIALMDVGKCPVSVAAKIVDESPAVQVAIAADIAEGMAPAKAVRKAKQAKKDEAAAVAISQLPPKDVRYMLVVGSCLDALSLQAESVDCIVTDPPYPREFLPVYRDLARVAAHALKPGGSLVCMCGQSYLPEVLAALGESLVYRWTLAYLTPGGQSSQLWERTVNTFWKPLLWFTKGTYSGPWIGDVCKSNVNDNDKRHHHWGQSESGMADIVGRFTKPGDTVLDPFCGGGTTGVVAIDMDRLFIGYDIDAAAIDTTRVRLI
jgi:site-specific DNA-methyltransferase (adenine-specific)